MQDRTPTPGQEGRALIAPEDGSPAYYAKITMADNPTQEGTPYNKSSVLQDITCDVLQISRDSVVNDALLSLGIGLGRYGFVITVTDPTGTPVPGAIITGLDPVVGDTLTTNADGVAIGISNQSTATLQVKSPYLDLQSITNLEVSSDQKLHQVSVQLSYVEPYVLVESSGEYALSPSVTSFDVTAVGGGGGGVGGSTKSTISHQGGGGGGGYVTTELDIQNQNGFVTITIGSGGSALNTYKNNTNSWPFVGATGGSTLVHVNEQLVASANGGSGGIANENSPMSVGGTGNGNGGSQLTASSAGGSGSGYIFGDESLGVAGGGGGGGYRAGATPTVNPNGGSPFGATGGYYYNGDKSATHAGAASGPGGGGGGGAVAGMYAYIRGSAGGNGGVYLRFYR